MPRTENRNGNGHGVAAVEIRLPHNIEAERGVLGGMLLNNEVIPEVLELVEAREFYMPGHQLIFQAMKDLWNAGSAVELLTIVDEMRKRDQLEAAGGYTAIASMEQFVFSSGAAPGWAAIVAEKAKLRRMVHIAEKAMRMAMDERDLGEIADEAQGAIVQLVSSNPATGMELIGDVSKRVLDRLMDPDAKDNLLSTGYDAIDEALGGGIPPKSLWVVGARPSVGKTAFASNVLIRTAQLGHGSLFFTLEMTKEQLQERFYAQTSEVFLSKIRRNQVLAHPYDVSRVQRAHQDMAELPIILDETPKITLSEVCRKARIARRQMERAGKQLKFVMIDYLQIMSLRDIDHREFPSKTDKIGEVTSGLKALAKELGIVVVLLSQFSRGVAKEERRARMDDLRDSGSIEQDADVVGLLSYGKVDSNGGYIAIARRAGDQAEIVYDNAKNRQAQAGQLIPMIRNGPLQRFGCQSIPKRDPNESPI